MEAESTSLMLMAAGGFFGGLLLLPSAGYAFLDLIGKPSSRRLSFRRPWLWVSLIIPVALLGHWISNSTTWAWLFLPPLHIAAIGLSVYGLVLLGRRGLSIGSPQKTWGVLGSGLALAPALSLVAELAAIAILGLLVILYLSRDPHLVDEILKLSDVLINAPDSQEIVFEWLEPYLIQPGVLYIVLAFTSIIIPLIEELLKPIGVWLLAGRGLTAAQGFSAGLLSGAGYALFENLALSSGAGVDWGFIILSRMGTSVIHILTAGLTGWALALAWNEGRYLRLGLTYFGAVLIHGTWNGLAVLSAMGEIYPADNNIPDFVFTVGNVAPIGIILLAGAGFAALVGINTSLRRAIIAPASSPPNPIEAESGLENGEVNLNDEGNLTHGIDHKLD
jgi:hypothetical protein